MSLSSSRTLGNLSMQIMKMVQLGESLCLTPLRMEYPSMIDLFAKIFVFLSLINVRFLLLKIGMNSSCPVSFGRFTMN